jgi:probable HAF family extracellular repeat protein
MLAQSASPEWIGRTRPLSNVVQVVKSLLPVVLFAAGCLAASHARAVSPPVFVPLGTLGGSDSFGESSRALGVSDDGTAVVGDSLASVGLGVTKGIEAFIWTQNKGMKGLGALSDEPFSSTAWDVSRRGTVVVGHSHTPDGRQAFSWQQDRGIRGLGCLPRHYRSVAYGVSANGKVIVGLSSSSEATLAFRWTEETNMVSLGDLPGGGTSSAALAVSADGRVIVGRGSSQRGQEAFRWTSEDGLVGLGDLPGGEFYSAAYGVSEDGQYLVGEARSAAGTEAFLWSLKTGMTKLGDLADGDFASTAYAVSATGHVVVGRASGPDGAEAFVWTADGRMQSLHALVRTQPDLHNWELEAARDVSADGTTIVGVGRNPAGQPAAWLLQMR